MSGFENQDLGGRFQPAHVVVRCRLRMSDGEELWMGLCAYCLLAMAKALSQAEALASAEGNS